MSYLQEFQKAQKELKEKERRDKVEAAAHLNMYQGGEHSVKEHEKILTNIRQTTRSRALSAKMKHVVYKDLTALAVDDSSPSKIGPLTEEESSSSAGEQDEIGDVIETEDEPVVESGLAARRIAEAEASQQKNQAERDETAANEDSQLVAANETEAKRIDDEEEQQEDPHETADEEEITHAELSSVVDDDADEIGFIPAEKEAVQQNSQEEEEKEDDEKEDETDADEIGFIPAEKEAVQQNSQEEEEKEDDEKEDETDADEIGFIPAENEAAEQHAQEVEQDDEKEDELVAAAAAVATTETDDGTLGETRKDVDFAFGLFSSTPPDSAMATQAAAEIVPSTIHQQQPMGRGLKVSYNPNFPPTVCKIEKDETFVPLERQDIEVMRYVISGIIPVFFSDREKSKVHPIRKSLRAVGSFRHVRMEMDNDDEEEEISEVIVGNEGGGKWKRVREGASVPWEQVLDDDKTPAGAPGCACSAETAPVDAQ